MNFYLQTVSPDDFMEINQAVTLSGVIAEPWQFTRRELDVEATIRSLLEVMSESQKIYIQALSGGFRSMLEEGKRLQKLSTQTVLCVPASEQGLMCMKAASRMHLPVAAAQIFQVEQAVLSMQDHAGMVLLDLEKIGRFTDAGKVLKTLMKILPEEKAQNLIVCCSALEQLREAMEAGASQFCAPVDVYHQMLFSVLTGSETDSMREEWILTYTRNEVLE